MKWFDILKVLGTKSNFSQLDFDNIVIEDDDDCKKQWQAMCDRIEKAIKGLDLSSLLDDDMDYEFAEGLIPSHAAIGESRYTDSYGKYARGGGGFKSKEFKEGYRAKIDCSWGYNPKIPEEVYCAALDILSRLIRGESKLDSRIGDYSIKGLIEGKNTTFDDERKDFTVKIFDYVAYMNGEADIISIEIHAMAGKKIEEVVDKMLEAILEKLK